MGRQTERGLSRPVAKEERRWSLRTITIGSVARKAIRGPARRRNEQARALHRDRRLRPGASAGRRQRADRRRRSGVHAAGAGGDLLPRLPPRRFRHLRTVDEQLHGEDRERRLSVCRRAGVPVARVPPQLDLYPHRPRHRAARGPEGQARRRAGISGHRQRLDARRAGRRARREAVGHQLGARRLRTGGTHREDRAEPAGQRARARMRRTVRPSPACWPTARSMR